MRSGPWIILVLVVALVVRVALTRARRRRMAAAASGTAEARPSGPAWAKSLTARVPWRRIEASLGDVGLVAGREIRERVRGRIFKVGTAIMVLGVAAVIVIPKVASHQGPTVRKLGVVGRLSPDATQVLQAAARANQDKLELKPEASLAAAKTDLRSGRIDAAIVDEDELYVNKSTGSGSSAVSGGFVEQAAQYLGVLQAYRQAGLTPAQAAVVSHARPVAVHSLAPKPKAAAQVTSTIGLVLLFVMLTQYCSWIMIGVMQEKSSRVVEVLLAMVRPIQLLAGKVLGIGLVALGQVTLLVGTALVLGAAVGSDVLQGSAPLGLLAEALWLVLGYAFYCWAYAAAGSMAERQDQVQTLVLPLSLPTLFAYIYSITVASSGNPNIFFDVLAYLPPTAPFCMSVLVGLGRATWWEFTASVLISLVSTYALALAASRIYRRAVLRTGGRVRLRDLRGRTTG